MKTVASFLLIAATFVVAIAYAEEPSGELDYPPAANDITSLSRAQVIAELEAAKAVGRLIFGEAEAPTFPAADSNPTREQARANAVTAHADGSYTFGELNYDATL